MVDVCDKEKIGYDFKAFTEWFAKLEEGESIETLPRSVVAGYHQRAAEHIVEFASRMNAFYREKYALGIGRGFREAAFLTKEELRGGTHRIRCNPNIAHVHVSTGTTGGEPIYIGHTLDDLYLYDTAPRYPRLLDTFKHSTVAIALPYEMSSSGLSFHRYFQFVLQCNVLPVGKGGVYAPPEKTLSFLQHWSANVMVTSPSYAIALGEAARGVGLASSDIGIRHIFLTGEGASPSLRKRIERMWGCSATVFYGSLEAGLIGIECREQQGFHVAEGHVYVEIIDPVTGAAVSAGQVGEIVVTTLLREGMPVIRYRTGDLGFLEETACSCGVHMPRLHLRGRVHDQLRVKGQRYSYLYIEDHIMQVPEAGNWYRIFVTPEENIVLEIEPADSEVDQAYLMETLRNKLEFLLNTDCTVNVVEQVARSNGKEQRVQYL